MRLLLWLFECILLSQFRSRFVPYLSMEGRARYYYDAEENYFYIDKAKLPAACPKCKAKPPKTKIRVTGWQVVKRYWPVFPKKYYVAQCFDCELRRG